MLNKICPLNPDLQYLLQACLFPPLVRYEVICSKQNNFFGKKNLAVLALVGIYASLVGET